MKNLSNEPKHIAIIMDGNMRWAMKNSLPSLKGYQSGMEATKAIILAAINRKIKNISLFALSSENIKRPTKQTRELLKVFDQALDEGIPEFHEKGAKFNFIGERGSLPSNLVRKMNEAEELTAKNSNIEINIAINYGGRWDILQACRTIAKLTESKQLNANKIQEKHFDKYLSLADQPPIDLCIRTGNEQRISNFFLWQLAYTELYFSKVYWPEFSVRRFYGAINDYKKRARRFGASSIA